MRPLRGLDCNLERNLESTFKQNYVNFEIICGIESVDDSAYQVYMDVARRYPNVKSRIIVGLHV